MFLTLDAFRTLKGSSSVSSGGTVYNQHSQKVETGQYQNAFFKEEESTKNAFGCCPVFIF